MYDFLNENPYGPSPGVALAVQLELERLSRYADEPLAHRLAKQIAEYEQIPVQQVVLGGMLDLLGSLLRSSGGPGGEFLYSTPGLPEENRRAQNTLRASLKEA